MEDQTQIQPQQPKQKGVDWLKIRTAILAKHPNLNKTQLSKLDETISRRASQELVKGGTIPLSDFALKDPIGAASLQAQGITNEAQLTTDQIKRREDLLTALPVAQRIADSALTAPTGLFGFAQSALGRIPGYGGGEAEFLRRQNEGFARLIGGVFAKEAGVATDEDVKRWQALLPQPGDTYDERVRALKDLLAQVEQESKIKKLPVPELINTIRASVDEAEKQRSGADPLKKGLMDVFGFKPQKTAGNQVGRFSIEEE